MNYGWNFIVCINKRKRIIDDTEDMPEYVQ